MIKGLDIPEGRYHEIAEMIHSDSSPVGIDARKTHVMILHLLLELEERIKELERKVDSGSSNV